MIQQARKRLLIATLTFLMSGAVAVPVEAGIVPWVWDTVFGPVGSIRARRMCQVGYGARNRCGYGPMMLGSCGTCSPCGGSPCSSGSCGVGCGYGSGGGYYGGAVSVGGCATGECGINFNPSATSGNLSPRIDNPPPASTPGLRTNPPTFRDEIPNGSGSSGRTGINNGLNGAPRTAPEEFPTSRDGESTIPEEKRTPSKVRPGLPAEDDAFYRPAPMNHLGEKVTWSSASKLERMSGRDLGTRSVRVTRQGAFPNSKWEVAGENREVAKK